MTAQKTACLVAAFCLYAAATFIYAPVITDRPFAYDDADYMWAGKQGLVANYTSRHAISFVEFVRMGLELSHDPGKRQSFSEFIRSTGDMDFYRHYHGPMYSYWLALLHDAGIHRENVFRGSGLPIHFATATMILLGIWAVFPSLPPLAGLVACALFVFNRSALTAGTTVTQHVLFTFFCIASLLACSMFMRRLAAKWFYVTLALISCALCTVETSILLLGALGLSMIAEHRRVREKWPTLKALGGLLARGTGVFLLTMVICWPMGLLQLGIAKGFLSLVYFAFSRKTYTSHGTLALWSARFQASPWEFSLLVVGTIMAFVLWRGFANRRELLPWLAFIVCFLLVTLKMSLEYTYYYAPLTAAFTVVSGVAAGILWTRGAWAVRTAVLLAVIASITGTTLQFREILREGKAERSYQSVVLSGLSKYPVAAGQKLYLPYQLVPMLHYYHPDLSTVGYDFDFPLSRLAAGTASGSAAGIMFCEKSFCDALEALAPGFYARKTLLDAPGPNGQPFYLIQLPKSRSL